MHPKLVAAVVASLLPLAACSPDATDPADSLDPKPADLTVSPRSLDFGETEFDLGSPTLSVSVTNVGAWESGPLTTAVSGEGAAEFLVERDECRGRALVPGMACRIDLRLRPGTPAIPEAHLTIAGSDGQSASATLRGTRVGHWLRFDEDDYYLGEAGLGVVADVRTLTVTNHRRALLEPLTVTVLTSGRPADIEIVRDLCTGRGLQVGESCLIDVRMRTSSPGLKAAFVQVAWTSSYLTTMVVGRVRDEFGQ